MNKTNLQKKLSEKFDMTNAKAEEVADFIFDDYIPAQLAANGKFSVKNFGTLRVKTLAAREGTVTNQHGEFSYDVPERNTVRFTPSKDLKTAVAVAKFVD